jgi:hypothetical protein
MANEAATPAERSMPEKPKRDPGPGIPQQLYLEEAKTRIDATPRTTSRASPRWSPRWTVVPPKQDPERGGTFVFNPRMREPGPQQVVGKTYADHGVEQGRAVLLDLARDPKVEPRDGRVAHNYLPPKELHTWSETEESSSLRNVLCGPFHGNRVGWNKWARSSAPSMTLGPGRAKYALASTA